MKTLQTLKCKIAAAALAALALAAAPLAADFLILDDLIVDGSACIGFDCVNGESFGFDTIRLKENNLRIRADDTSTASSYPREDWQIVFNDSANGGTSRFSVEDLGPIGSGLVFTIEAGAGSNALYVDDGGRLGLGTSTPSVELHIIDGDTPTLRLQQDGSSGFAPQTWDVAGNETNFFIRDVTNGSTLPLRIRPGAPSNTIFMDLTGDVGFGTSSPDEPIHIRRTDATPTVFFVENANAATQRTGLKLQNATTAWAFEMSGNGNFQINEEGSGGAEFNIDENATGNQVKFSFNDGGTDLVDIEADGDVLSATGVYGTISDRDAKRDIVPVDPADVLARVAAMPISTWRYKKNSDELHMGPMAQDFWAAFGLHQGPTTLAVNDVAGVALAAVQGLEGEIRGLRGELEARELRIRELEGRLAALEARLTE